VPSEHEAGTGPPDPEDPQFSLPALGDPPSTEVGVILLGVEAGQLLAGLGLASLAEDPATVTLLIEQIRHAGVPRLALGHLVEIGADRWRAARDGLPAGLVRTASLREAWAQAYDAVRARPGCAPAAAVYLTACWLRRVEIDAYLAATPGLPPWWPADPRRADVPCTR
jgi:Family of unknown function (DUF6187)